MAFQFATSWRLQNSLSICSVLITQNKLSHAFRNLYDNVVLNLRKGRQIGD